MSEKITIIFNEPNTGMYPYLGEGVAIEGILKSVQSVTLALNKLGYLVQTLALKPPLSLARTELKEINADLVFNLFEGFDGWPESEAAIAYFLEDLGYRFTGCPSKALRICEDKSEVKKLISRYAIPTPEWQVMYPSCAEKFNMEFPCIVKPSGEHASHALSPRSVVYNESDLTQQIEFIWEHYHYRSIVEKFLPGREFRATIIENGHLTLLPIGEIIYNLPPGNPKLLTYSAKWLKENEYFIGTSEQCPADIDQNLKKKIGVTAATAFTVTGCRNYASIDLRQNEEGELMVIDINPNPDISSEGGVMLPVKAFGMSYTAFIEMIVSSAKKEKQKTADDAKSGVEESRQPVM